MLDAEVFGATGQVIDRLHRVSATRRLPALLTRAAGPLPIDQGVGGHEVVEGGVGIAGISAQTLQVAPQLADQILRRLELP